MPELSRISRLILSREPARAIISACATWLWSMLSSSGKCRPYHSRILVLVVLIILSSSSSPFIDWTMCRSSFSDASFTREDESSIAKSRRACMASVALVAKPAFTI